ncbi:SMP-30/gluconolactonase/LRE family protein [Sandaracinobacteroides hominis]|uniref:SMP-30/gluconolactonase/LRE family protein n=1 Tax=Sandaracinobacteroides hominis TaxID=2780086 RepID=UPI0018F5E402|nr:SMP-30/gluconolactonase/LRE family protein [Sandaracinobacteroides hominis]
MPAQPGEPQSVWTLGAPLLEGPVWVGDALWFVDIKSRKLHCLGPDGTKQSWDAPEQIGFCLPTVQGDFIAGLQSGLARFDPQSGAFAPMVDPEPHRPGNRLNDATVDSEGRLWFGTMDDGEREKTGHIYRLGADGRCHAETAAVSISNGPAVSPDGRTLYHVDTLGGRIHAATIGADGSLSDERLLIRIAPTDGYPDGPAVDAEGCIWVGLYNGWAVRRYSPAGELLETIRFPVSAITKVAFGGPGLTTLYATTARKHVGEAQLAKEPLAGDLFALPVSVAGIPAVPVSIGL